MIASALKNSQKRLLAAVLVPAACAALALALSAQSTALPDPCTLLTKAEIQEAIGTPVGDGKLTKNPNPVVGNTCNYSIPPYGSFSLLLRPLQPSETPERIQAAFETSKPKMAVVPNLGDKSIFFFPGYGMVQLHTFKGKVYILFTLMIPGATEEASKTAAEKMMRKVLAKL